MHRVAITGLGCVSALGLDVASFWASLSAGRSTIGSLKTLPTQSLNVRIGAEIRDYNAARYFDPEQIALLGRFAQFALLAAREAVRDAGLNPLGSASHRDGCRPEKWGRRPWSVRVFTVPGTPAVDGGAFRYLRHPNCLGVILEIAAVPLLHGAVLTALGFSLANAALLRVRIRIEERALQIDNDYDRLFGQRRRLIHGRRVRT